MIELQKEKEKQIEWSEVYELKQKIQEKREKI